MLLKFSIQFKKQLLICKKIRKISLLFDKPIMSFNLNIYNVSKLCSEFYCYSIYYVQRVLKLIILKMYIFEIF